MTDWRHARTERLWLDVAAPGDEDDLFAIHSDPASWVHFPGGVHTDPASGLEMVATSGRQFDANRLGYWSVRDRADGPVVGRAGCTVITGQPWWNLYYRFATAVQRRGYAAEAGLAAITAARDVEPDRPVLAYLLEHNAGSRRTAERLGMTLVWRGPDDGNPDPGAVRLVFLDREPDAVVSAAIERYCSGD